MTDDLANAALDYCSRGWPVVPLHSWTGTSCTCGRSNCSSPAKHPRTTHGLKDASTELADVVGWWRRWPGANIGLLTGVAFDVLDIDGPEGMEAINQAAPWYGEPWDGGPGDDPTIDGPTVITGRGHHVYLAVTGRGNNAPPLPHVDWRGKGGYVVAPPSLHASGRRYEWFPGWGLDREIVPAPAWLLELLRKPAPCAIVHIPVPGRSAHAGAYAQRALESECGKVALAPEGSRNATLNNAALALGGLIKAGLLDPGDVADALYAVAMRAGLEHREAVATIRSGFIAATARRVS